MNNGIRRRQDAEELANARLQRVVKAAIRQYIVVLGAPLATLVIGACAFFGFNLKQGADELHKKGVEQLAKAAEQQKRVDSELEKVEKVISRLNDLEKDITARTERLEQTLERGEGRLDERTQAQLSQLLVLSEKIAETKAKVGESERNLERTARAMESTIANVGKTASTIDSNLRQQNRMMAGNIVETFTLRSYGTRAIRLPMPDKPVMLFFRVANLQSTSQVFYSVDAAPPQTAFFSETTSEFAWLPVPQTDGLYEFRPEILFYAKGKIRDFITITVRRTQLTVLDVTEGPR